MFYYKITQFFRNMYKRRLNYRRLISIIGKDSEIFLQNILRNVASLIVLRGDVTRMTNHLRLHRTKISK